MKLKEIFKIITIAFLLVLAIGQVQLIYLIKYGEDLINIYIGIPFSYFFFTLGGEFHLQGFIINYFFYDLLISIGVLFLIRFLSIRRKR